jgi:hypothetical protein
MENLWKLKDLGYGLTDLADRAEYNRLLKRFHEEERQANTANLLYGESSSEKGNLPGKTK